MDAKKIMSKALAPAALNTAERSVAGFICTFILNQPKLPKKLMSKVK